jgi:hypothetical protein
VCLIVGRRLAVLPAGICCAFCLCQGFLVIDLRGYGIVYYILGRGISYLSLGYCSRVNEVVLELPHVQPTACVVMSHCSVREVLGGG